MSCSGVNIFTRQKPKVAPDRSRTARGMIFRVAVGSGVPMTSPARKENRRISSWRGLTQTTLSGMPLLDQRLASLNQRMRTTMKVELTRFNELREPC